MKVLLIWKQSADLNRFFAIEDPTSEELGALREANGAYINQKIHQGPFNECGLHGLDVVHAAISSPERLQGYAGYALSWFSRWLRSELDEDSVSGEGRFDRVFISGFYRPTSVPAKLFVMRSDIDSFKIP